jgi:hypothetical protein
MKDKLRFSAVGKGLTLHGNESFKFGGDEALKSSIVNYKNFFRGKRFENTTSREYGSSSDNEGFKSLKTGKQSKQDQKNSEDQNKIGVPSEYYSNKNKKINSHASIN